MRTEQWRAVPTWEGYYEVSDGGNVRSVRRLVAGRFGPSRWQGKTLKPSYSTGYAMVTLVATGSGRRQQYYVHDLVLQAFVGPRPANQETCHGPAGAQVNALDNLRYDTRRNNALDRHHWGIGWKSVNKKPPTDVQCAICESVFSVRKRRTAPIHVCKNPACRQAWGYICAARKKTRR